MCSVQQLAGGDGGVCHHGVKVLGVVRAHAVQPLPQLRSLLRAPHCDLRSPQIMAFVTWTMRCARRLTWLVSGAP